MQKRMNTPQITQKLSEGNLLLGWETESKTPPSVGFQSNHSPPVNQPAPAGASPGPANPLFAAPSEGHGMVFAPTGRGKTRNALVPHLLTYPGPAIVIDVKGELTRVTANRRRAMGQKVYVLDPFGITDEKTASFNPFDLLENVGRHLPVEHLAMSLPGMLHGTGTQSLPDPFWDIRADGLLAGVAGAVAKAFPGEAAEKRNLIYMRELLMSDDSTYNLAVLLDTRKQLLPQISYQQIGTYLGTEDKCRSGIHATAIQHFDFTYGIEHCLTSTSIDLEALRAGRPVTVYLAMPPDYLESHGNLLRLWISALFSLLLARTRRPKRETLFLLDEAAKLGELDQLRTALTLMRGYGVRTFSFWQDIDQLEKTYKDWKTLINNCGSIQMFGANNCIATKSLARLVGKAASADDILELPNTEQYVIESGHVDRLRKTDYLRDPVYAGLYDRNPMYDPDPDDEPDPELPGLAA